MVGKACIEYNLLHLKQLVTRDNVNVPTNDIGYTPFEFCCARGNVECVKWFINDFESVDLFSGLYYACETSNTSVVTFMIDTYPQLLSYNDVYGVTILNYASSMSHDLIKLILKANPSAVNIKNKAGNTPLALLMNFEGKAKLIMQYGGRLKDVTFYIPEWARTYETLLNYKRNKCKSAGIALLIALREKGVPKDLARHIIKRFVLSSWLDDVWE